LLISPTCTGKRALIGMLLMLNFMSNMSSQIPTHSFGKGIQFLAKDSSFYLKMNFRIQNQMSHTWAIDNGSLKNHDYSMLIRRSRISFNGWAVSTKVKYKFEMGLSNSDVDEGDGIEFNKTANLILDAWLSWNFYKNLSIQFGQGKLPGNRERVISSASMQFVDRSILNSQYNIDRDVGFQILHHHTIGKEFLIRTIAALSQGEGRNVTAGGFGGANYTLRMEILPFGKFRSKGDYIGSAIKKESKPKVSLGVSYDKNVNAVRERGQLGNFIRDDMGAYVGNNLNTLFIDLMFKYQNWSILAEYADKKTGNGSPFVFSESDDLIGTFYTGTGLNVQTGYMFKKNWEVAGRFTAINPQAGVDSDEVQYTIGFSKFIAGHKLKAQTDFTLRDRVENTNEFFWRTQVEFQF